VIEVLAIILGKAVLEIVRCLLPVDVSSTLFICCQLTVVGVVITPGVLWQDSWLELAHEIGMTQIILGLNFLGEIRRSP
jgi:hypothetical protein